ncbi:hypothetical protein Q5741_12325 [Paenibacillus sp. JX-17]|uniref:Uncharacterized protein n=1 Tax=Paenibacillus lacisoli TaxID=3064525 RepID=A0ABT9CHQ0_9BACL|nr:hypothetical protein [Paenibacillus sp. JX-17]MDO7907196.1 hypothetical protein [Paenibacillus sp. JX-17]
MSMNDQKNWQEPCTCTSNKGEKISSKPTLDIKDILQQCGIQVEAGLRHTLQEKS